jgi:hypothetical protein
MRFRLHIPFVTLTLLFGQAPAWAGDIPWSSLSKDEQRILYRARDQWDQYPTERQRRLLRGAQRWQGMDDAEREDAKERWHRQRNKPHGEYHDQRRERY